MNRQSSAFLVTFGIAAAAVVPLVLNGLPLYGLAAGMGGLLLHWLLSRGGDRDGEVADSSYFFGFLLTLVFLAVGLFRIGAASAAGGTAQVLGFLMDLAAGLGLTIFGLLIRQIRTLATTRTNGNEERALLAAQRELTDNLKTLAELWRTRPEQQVLEQLNESRAVARDAAEQLDRSVAAAGTRIVASVERLDDATTTATQAITRAAAGAGASLTQMAERLEADMGGVVSAVQSAVTEVLTSVEQQRLAANEAFAHAQAHHREQLELWRASLDQAKASLVNAQRGLDDEYRRGMDAFAASGTAFAQLAEQTAERVQALPNPADRLAGLWDGVRRLETDLTEAIAGSVMELGSLRERSQELAGALERLGSTTDATARAVGAGGERLGGALHRELEQMNAVIDEYVTLLERTTRQLKVRA